MRTSDSSKRRVLECHILVAIFLPLCSACGGLITSSNDAPDGSGQSDSGIGADAEVDSSVTSDGTVLVQDGGADQAVAMDAEDDDDDDDSFSYPYMDASPDSRAGIAAHCLSVARPYLSAPIIPPYAAAGLDMRGGPTGDGSEGWDPSDAGSFHYNPSLEGTVPITISEVESVLCDPGAYVTCVEVDDAGGVQTCEGLAFAGFNTWGGFAVYYGAPDGGPPYDVWAIQLQSWIGGGQDPNLTYAGTIEATGTDGTHESIGLRVPIMQTPSGSGSATAIDFASNVASDGGGPTATTKALVNDLYAAMMTQFLPGQAVAPDCFASAECGVVVTLPSYIETLVFVPLHVEIDIVINGPVYNVPTNSVIDMLLYSAPPPTSG
jgi:hypothetical protein